MADMETSQSGSTKNNYNSWTKEELISRLTMLESKNETKNQPAGKVKKNRTFSWDKVAKRHIFLKFMYFGWDYHGYMTQIDTDETIENYMMLALKKCCLIENRETSNYHRCGRTDAGVSAFSQVISLDVRSKLSNPDESNMEQELEYCKMLNRILPIYIRCYSWCHVGATASARFDCTSRSYNYFFPVGNLNISAMKSAADFLLGTHDFRNLCKMDVNNGVVEFIRTIDDVKIFAISSDEEHGYQVMKLEIKSRGFLWHQIRCIMAVLLLVGEGNEEPSIVSTLLDINRVTCKPQYHMASPLPLTLSDTAYENLNLVWQHSPEEIEYLCGQLQGLWTEYAVKQSMVRDALIRMKKILPNAANWQKQKFLVTGVLSKIHVPLLDRQTCQSLDDRIINVQKKKQKLDEFLG